MFWVNTSEYLGNVPTGGDTARWEAARVKPQVAVSKPGVESEERSGGW